ncbi:uncharacterized protein TRUGW13939_09447 [Talaromyces rugulosus]|uniref:Rhodopsin domain-containing protein n=1 Tax=Talaromyces rugulosus TaxID=121627 RepID=A0A7H8R8Q3_TALRU|nr:uncharacterized protein TRUGW13939_09447 [Talaromyces rugulosus]QKX62288.1 hypothetical protein TRUGW13939_09447 [Talaromyces rugulosus]
MATQTSELSVPYATADDVYAAAIVLPVLGTVFLALRWQQRRNQREGIGIDDWLTVPSLVFTIGMGIALVIGVHGKAIGYPTPSQSSLTSEEQMNTVSAITKLKGTVQFAVIILLILAAGFLKLSIIFLYRRLFVVVLYGSPFDFVTIAAIAISAAWTITFVVVVTLSCGTHVSAQWGSPTVKAVYCGRSLDMENAFVVSDAVTNALIWLMPMPIIWAMHMRWPKKLAVTGILLIGSISVIASIIKIIISFQISGGGYRANVDPNLTVGTILYWCMIEAGLANIASNLPLFRGLFDNISLATIIRSVRSTISLDSMTPSGRGGRSQRTTQDDTEVLRSTSRPLDEESKLVDNKNHPLPMKNRGLEQS